MTSLKVKVEGLSCPACLMKIEAALKKLPGVKKARATLITGNVKTIFDETQVTESKIKETIENTGYRVINS